MQFVFFTVYAHKIEHMVKRIFCRGVPPRREGRNKKSSLFRIAALFLIAAATIPAFFAPPPFARAAPGADTPENGQRVLTVVMYHQVLKNTKGKYAVSPLTFERDLIELKRRGYETVSPSRLVRFAERGEALPKKPLLISFDDGYYNNQYYCEPILKKHGCNAVINIVGSYSEFNTAGGDHSNVNYSYLTWEQIRSLDERGVFEIGNHTFDMHRQKPRFGIAPVKNENAEQYEEALKRDIMKLQNKLTEECGVTPLCFAYPFGLQNKTAKTAILNMGFKVILTSYETRNIVCAGSPECLYGLGRFNRPSGISSAAFFDKTENSKLRDC